MSKSGTCTSDGSLKLSGIVLAAGSASRFGRPKQLAVFQDQKLLSIALNLARKVSEDVVLVTGAYASELKFELQAELKNFDADSDTNVDTRTNIRIVHNPDWQTGMGSSIRVAINSLMPDMDGVIILLADQPLVTESHLRVLVANWSAENPLDRPWAVATQYPSSQGAPALFDRKAFGDLIGLEADEGARALLNVKSKNAKSVEPDFPLIDIDTPKQLAELMLLVSK